MKSKHFLLRKILQYFRENMQSLIKKKLINFLTLNFIFCIFFQALIAFVTIVDDTTVSSSEIESFLQRTLPPYMLPQIFVVDYIPLLINGKTDRQTLLKQYESFCPNNGMLN